MTQATFMHIADVHLGNHQYQLDDRYNDFADALQSVCEDAIRRQVSALLIAGDLFHKRAIDAQTLFIANHCFNQLRQARIPVIAIEGNHDRAFFSDGDISWMSYLAWTGQIHLLSATLGEPCEFRPWDAESKTGGYVDVPGTGIRVYGVAWCGSQTSRLLGQIAEGLHTLRDQEERDGVHYRVLMLHTGLDGEVATLHGLPTRQQFSPLEGIVDYIALGHVHKPYEHDHLIFNPGSLETVSAEESAWETRGYYVDTVDPDATPRHLTKLERSKRRPFGRWTFPVDLISDPERLCQSFTDFCQRRDRELEKDKPAVIDIALRGTLPFDQGALDRTRLEQIARTTFTPAPLHVIIRNQTVAIDGGFSGDEEMSFDRSQWAKLETEVYRSVFVNDSQYAPHADELAHLTASLKRHALDGDEGQDIATWLTEERHRIFASTSSPERPPLIDQ